MHAKIEKVQGGLDTHGGDTLFLLRSSEAIVTDQWVALMIAKVMINTDLDLRKESVMKMSIVAPTHDHHMSSYGGAIH